MRGHFHVIVLAGLVFLAGGCFHSDAHRSGYTEDGKFWTERVADRISPEYIDELRGEILALGEPGEVDPQEAALLAVYTGQKGGPIADLAKLVGEVVSVEKVPVTFTVQGGRGTITLGNAGSADLVPYTSASGQTTTLTDTVFSTVPGAPVFVGKATSYKSKNAKLGIDLDISGHNALQSTFVFHH